MYSTSNVFLAARKRVDALAIARETVEIDVSLDLTAVNCTWVEPSCGDMVKQLVDQIGARAVLQELA